MSPSHSIGPLLFALILAMVYPLDALAGERSMGDGTKGDLQDLNGWNNDAIDFARETTQWTARWSPQNVAGRRGELAGEKGLYCLSATGDHKGAELLVSGNKTSKSYEGYLAAHADDSAARKAYEEHERRLHEFYGYWKKTHQAANCS